MKELSKRDKRILFLVAKGYSYRHIQVVLVSEEFEKPSIRYISDLVKRVQDVAKKVK